MPCFVVIIPFDFISSEYRLYFVHDIIIEYTYIYIYNIIYIYIYIYIYFDGEQCASNDDDMLAFSDKNQIINSLEKLS